MLGSARGELVRARTTSAPLQPDRTGQAIKVAKRSRGATSSLTRSVVCPRTSLASSFKPACRAALRPLHLRSARGPTLRRTCSSSTAGASRSGGEVSSAAIDAKVIDGLVVWATDFEGLAFNTSPDAAYEFRRSNGRLVAPSCKRSARRPTFTTCSRPRTATTLCSPTGFAPASTPARTTATRMQPFYDGVVQKLIARRATALGVVDRRTTSALARDRAAGGPTLDEPYDIVHINAVEPLADGDLLISLRHTDAVYRLDRATGASRMEARRDPYRCLAPCLDDPPPGIRSVASTTCATSATTRSRCTTTRPTSAAPHGRFATELRDRQPP